MLSLRRPARNRCAGRVAQFAMAPLLAVGLSACVSSSATVDTARLGGWQKPAGGGTGIYLCKEPACPAFRLVSYQAKPLGPFADNIVASENPATRTAFEKQLARAFSQGARGRNTRLRIDGAIRRYTFRGNPALAFALAGTEAIGRPPDPGYMIMIARGNTMHMIIAFAETRSAARGSAQTVASALQFEQGGS